jgi:RNA polymerase sigma-70 factor, ECF subfamily
LCPWPIPFKMRQNPESDLGHLLRSVAEGDRSAFRLLYEQAGPVLFAICSRILRDRAAAEDAFQEAMLRIWQKSYQFDPTKGGAMNWMVTVARRAALDRLPARRSVQLSLTDESVAALVEALPHQAPGDPGLAPDLRRCLGQLEQNHRQSVLLAYYYGLSYGELAAHSAVPVGTVKSWIHRAVEKLQRCLSQ